ncbi:MAG TPA: SDR family NAD(P)-dependent oxidoreductase [Verrucomicrobiae bacterium]|nr:SDR family NAD(P)-dependent oxidoreductase [Verrucomicrobiae bacterium]
MSREHHPNPATLRQVNGQARPALNDSQPAAVLITGGAGFIGTNLADRLLGMGRPVIIYDNLSRRGVEQNLGWLKERHGQRVRHVHGDVRDFSALSKAVKEAGQVFHLAAQVAVTTSLEHPFEDFEINARGTLNLLEALRALPKPPPLVFTSTNKVYGALSDIPLRVQGGRYEPQAEELRQSGFGENLPLHFHSPYGCSKGAACQYVQDYARTFGLPTVVFRMSCIYGPHQFGTEDAGWVAHFLIRALAGAPLTIYGDGRQVRDILFVEDLVDAFLLAQQHMAELAGGAFNIGGGPQNTTSLLELIELIGTLHGRAPAVRFADWRPADQQYYVSDTRKFLAATGWQPRVGVRTGVERLYHWLQEFPTVKAGVLALAGVQGLRSNGQVRRVWLRAIRPKTVPSKVTVKLKSATNGHRLNGNRAGQKLEPAIHR